MNEQVYTNYTLRMPTSPEIGYDLDFGMKKPATLKQIRKAVRDVLKHKLSITHVRAVELDDLILNWGVWDEMTVKIRKGEEVFESILGLHIDRHLEIMESYANILASATSNELKEMPSNPTEGLILIDEETKLGSFKARCGISDIVSG